MKTHPSLLVLRCLPWRCVKAWTDDHAIGECVSTFQQASTEYSKSKRPVTRICEFTLREHQASAQTMKPGPALTPRDQIECGILTCLPAKADTGTRGFEFCCVIGFRCSNDVHLRRGWERGAKGKLAQWPHFPIRDASSSRDIPMHPARRAD